AAGTGGVQHHVEVAAREREARELSDGRPAEDVDVELCELPDETVEAVAVAAGQDPGAFRHRALPSIGRRASVQSPFSIAKNNFCASLSATDNRTESFWSVLPEPSFEPVVTCWAARSTSTFRSRTLLGLMVVLWPAGS